MPANQSERSNQIITGHHPNKTINEGEPVSDPIFISTVFSSLWIYPSLTEDSSPRKPRAASLHFSEVKAWEAWVVEAWLVALAVVSVDISSQLSSTPSLNKLRPLPTTSTASRLLFNPNSKLCTCSHSSKVRVSWDSSRWDSSSSMSWFSHSSRSMDSLNSRSMDSLNSRCMDSLNSRSMGSHNSRFMVSLCRTSR